MIITLSYHYEKKTKYVLNFVDNSQLVIKICELYEGFWKMILV